MGRKGRGRSNHIPDGWQGCPPMGTGFVDDRFFVFKTPLKPDLNSKVPQPDRFSIENIFQRVQQMNNSRIGLWIDLTNTTRYYNPVQIQNQGIRYEKLACEGHGRPPSNRTISIFCRLVHNFFRQNRRDYVGVHCTHGFNRTGYLICCYLMQYRRYTAEEAVHEFSKHRQPGIYRQIYVNALYTMSLPLQMPIRVTEPEWLAQNDQRQSADGNSSITSSSYQSTSGNGDVNSAPGRSGSHNQINAPHIAALLPAPTDAFTSNRLSSQMASIKPPPVDDSSSSS